MYRYWLILLVSCFHYTLFAQIQPGKVDSMLALIQKDTLPPAQQYRLLADIAYSETNPHKTIFYARKAIAYHQKKKLTEDINYAKGALASGYTFLGEHEKAIKVILEIKELCLKTQELPTLAWAYSNLGETSGFMGNYENALKYYQQAIATFKRFTSRHEDSILYFTTLLNTGYNFYRFNKLNQAIEHTNQAKQIAQLLNYPMAEAYATGNLGLCYAKLGETTLAELQLATAIAHLSSEKDWRPVAEYKSEIAEVYLKNNWNKKALNLAMQADSFATIAIDPEIREITKSTLAKAFAANNDFKAAYKTHLAYVQISDSLNSINYQQEIQRLIEEHELGLKEAEIDFLQQNQKSQDLLMMAMAVAIILLIILAVILLRHKRRKQQMLELLQLKNQQLLRQNEQIKQFTTRALGNF